MSKKWKIFERIVAAIHHAESRGAKVVWNDSINGRQFDVTVRFKYGMYNYLTVIECKDQSAPIPIERVESFVTKSSDAKANKAIMVSSSGYQSGCLETAKSHDIELYELKEIYELTKEDLSVKFTPCINIYHVQLSTLENEKKILLPDQRNRLHYVLNNTVFKLGKKNFTLLNLIDKELLKLIPKANDKERSHKFQTSKDCTVFVPLIEKEVNLKEISFKYKIAPAVIVKGRSLDPFLLDQFGKKFSYNDVLNKIEKPFYLENLDLGFDNELEVGKYYYNPKIDFYYYCEKIEKESAQVYIVESFQHGRLIQMHGSIDMKYAKELMVVKDKKVLRRLEKHLIKLKR